MLSKQNQIKVIGNQQRGYKMNVNFFGFILFFSGFMFSLFMAILDFVTKRQPFHYVVLFGICAIGLLLVSLQLLKCSSQEGSV